MKVLVVTDETLSVPLVYATLESFLTDGRNRGFSEEEMGDDYGTMLSCLKFGGAWNDKTGSVAWVDIRD